MSYPNTPGWKGDSGVGRDAALMAAKHVKGRRALVLQGLEQGPGTSEQVAERIGLHWYLTRPRLSDLKALGQVIETGERGRGALGGPSTIWRLTTAEERAAFAARKADAA